MAEIMNLTWDEAKRVLVSEFGINYWDAKAIIDMAFEDGDCYYRNVVVIHEGNEMFTVRDLEEWE